MTGLQNISGVHGVRYHDGRLQAFRNGTWTDKPGIKVYGVRIDTANPDTRSSVIYTDDAAGMTGGSGDWMETEIFRDIRPCMFKDGAVQYYLSPGDYTKKEDGAPADITTGRDGDVMVEIPRLAYLLYREGQYQYVKVTAHPDARRLDSRFCYYGHTRVTEGDRDKLYFSAYQGSVSGGRLRSLSGKQPAEDLTMGNLRDYARASGGGYDIIAFYPLMLLQCLCLIYCGSTDCKGVLGEGHVRGRGPVAATGFTDGKGLFYGEATGTQPVKFLGIEDFWGNQWDWVDGVFTASGNRVLTAFRDFNDTGAGYTDRGVWGSAMNSWLTEVQGTNELGFLGKAVTLYQMPNQYWCTYCEMSSSYPCLYGGYADYGAGTGAYHMSFCLGPDELPIDLIGSRLMYL